MRLAVVDPGKTSGWVIASGFLQEVRCGETSKVAVLMHRLDEWQPEVLIAEAFRLYPWRAKEQFWGNMPAAEVVGAVKAWCEAASVRYVEQCAACRGIISDFALRRAGLWAPTIGKPHARDAARHLLYYYWRNGYESEVSRLLHRGGVNSVHREGLRRSQEYTTPQT
jgi:hypothetical protein